MTCKHCHYEYKCTHEEEHPGLCCDCYDLKWGMDLKLLNEERKEKGLPPILTPWPEREPSEVGK